jgi:hypothetical protein
MSIIPRRSVPVKSAALPALSTTVEAVMPAIERLIVDKDYAFLRAIYGKAITCFIDEISPEQRGALQREWPQWARPATLDEIAIAITDLLAAYPNLNNAGSRRLVHIVADDIAAEKPTIYELTTACREMRLNSEFFSQAVLFRQLKRARKRGDILALLASREAPDELTQMMEDQKRRLRERDDNDE